MRVYTDIWEGFQFRAPTYLDGHFEPYKFDLVKWEDHNPYEVTDWYTGEKKMSTKSCFSIGTLEWDTKEYAFGFKSCGLRYLKYRVDGLEKFILDFCTTIERQLTKDVDQLNEVNFVAHGKWLINPDGYYPYCSVCQREPENGKMTKHCPNCGSTMDLV